LLGSDSLAPTQVHGEQDFGIRWDGEYEALSRLIFELGKWLRGRGRRQWSHARSSPRGLHAKLFPSLFELLLVAAMPIHDAVDLARFLVETTNGLVKFSVARPRR
jgi:hypothetical protein